MRSAPCAWAPSHTLHAMPSRITRNSHRPRASDRTMVDLEHQFGLPLFRTRWHRHHPRRKLMSMGNRPSFSREAQLQWAGSRETNLASGRGRTFFLTSLFIELIELVLVQITGFDHNLIPRSAPDAGLVVDSSVVSEKCGARLNPVGTF
jgi:hypothetical protein